MSWLLFFDWNRLLDFSKLWVYSVGFALASVSVLTAWFIWSETLNPQQEDLTQQLTLQHTTHIAYLNKLEELSITQQNHQLLYQQQVLEPPTALSKVDVFNHISSRLSHSPLSESLLSEPSVLLTHWQWQASDNSHRLVIELEGEFLSVGTFVRWVMGYSDFVIMESIALSRESVHSSGVKGRIEFAFLSLVDPLQDELAGGRGEDK
ncbi:hypothetical protein A9264_03685 [Vibrio sp. UCD-FRSSP16_10]|uniref:hypothetical protein n=1 Tax=unclassified Vibrio TaxID=2614977 RepID=UPI0007FC2882|nr:MULTISPECIES: hypothetical protein [unclassified Vibrio]OBT10072.1 hypothetical protein A9260_05135 [Vibrio sp. UCD-FRSSP16_30]OBT18862.1 hypothetical protein A9264_03685 [Vibrio sp. UCD-FRSSP16_10]